MKKITAFIALTGCVLVFLQSCKNDASMKVSEDGLMYKIIEDKSGDLHPQIGDLVEFHANVRIRDSQMANSYLSNNGEPFKFVLQEIPFKSHFSYGFKLLTEGDSAIFYVPFDSVKKYQQGQYPDWIKDNDTFVYEIRLVSIKTKDVFEAEQKRFNDSIKRLVDSMTTVQIVEDDKVLQAYFAKNNISPKKTASGLYYTIVKEGTGNTIQPGQVVSAKYTGLLLDGTKFDSNVDPSFGHTDLFKVVAGQGQVIPGWDEGLLLLKKGSKAKFYIPSALAYGPNGMGDKIPGSANLIFDVEIVDVTSSPNANQ